MCSNFVVVFVSILQSVSSFYLPGLEPRSYCKEGSADDNCKTTVDLYVNRLTTSESAIPYDYIEFDFCAPKDTVGKKEVTENLGQVLFGDRIHASPIQFTFGKNETCHVICNRAYQPRDRKLKFLKYGMLFSYESHWIVDNLPVAWCYKTTLGQQYCGTGFPMGCYVNKKRQQKDACQMDSMFNAADTFYLFNHVDIFIRYHTGDDRDWKGARIVKVTVNPRSFKDDKCAAGPLEIANHSKAKVNIYYTYSVFFVPDNTIEWASRWDYILDSTPNSTVQWFSIANSLVIVLMLLGKIALIMFRCLRKDPDESKKPSQWKLIRGDVFRPPTKPVLFAAVNGVGTQIFVMMFVTLFFACLGLLSPPNRGALETAAIVLFVLFSPISGFTSARLYKTFGGERLKMNAAMTAFLISGTVFTVLFLKNLIYWGVESSAAIPIFTLVAVLALWLGINVPLTFIGAYFGYKKLPIKHPVETDEFPRPIPHQRFYTGRTACILMGGTLPFGCIFIQLFFILNSIWSNQVYYMFGLVFFVTVILVVTCSEVAVILCYVHLSREDYRWWWRSFLTAGFTAVYVFIYAIYFYVTKLAFEGATSAILYVGYSLIMALLIFLFTGTVGFMSCFWFVTKIYSVVSREDKIYISVPRKARLYDPL